MTDHQTKHVFISYVRENQDQVERLCKDLKSHGVNVWLDRNDIKPGARWKDAIREAIRHGDFFLACFSDEYTSKAKTHMNEELVLAIEELRQYPPDRELFFIPVLLSECDVPPRNIGAGETLLDINWVPLYEDWNAGIQRILSVIKPAPQTIEVFFSYAHEDEELRDQLAKHLSILEREGVISAWHDRQIVAGKDWAEKISEHLDKAQIILLLVSADFFASDYCHEIEMKRALKRHEAKEARVIPIILKPVDWQGAPFGKLQALPENGKPVTTWVNIDEAFLDIAKGIRSVTEEFKGRKKEEVKSKSRRRDPDNSNQPKALPQAWYIDLIVGIIAFLAIITVSISFLSDENDLISETKYSLEFDKQPLDWAVRQLDKKASDVNVLLHPDLKSGLVKTRRFSVHLDGATLEEMLNVFCANAAIDVPLRYRKDGKNIYLETDR